MNVYMKVAGARVATNTKVQPEERLIYAAGDIPFTALTVRFWLRNALNQELFPGGVDVARGFENEVELDSIAPNQIGKFYVIAQGINLFGGVVETSPAYWYEVSADAPARKKLDWSSGLTSALKWTVVAVGVIAVGYFVVQSGGLAKAAGRARA